MYEDDEDYSGESQSTKLRTLKKRRNFLLLTKKGNTVTTKGLVVQFAKATDFVIANDDFESEEASEQNPAVIVETDIHGFSTEIGFTASKKIGSSVYRNRAKRRLKEAARTVLKNHPKLFRREYKYNVIARHAALDRDFESLVRDLKYALHNVK